MIVDHRTYDLHPGKLGPWLENYERVGLPVQEKHLGRLLGFFTVEIGPINQVVFMWAYDDMADRERRRAAMEADPAWAEYRRRSGALGALKQQTNKILKPASFSPIR